VWSGTATALREDVLEIDLAVEGEGSVWQYINPMLRTCY
jgi:hypothetical protein